MNVIAISNKLFMICLVLLMLVFLYHGFGWKRLRQGRPEAGAEMPPRDRPLAVLRNPLLWVALAGIALSILITL
jgi:hypothetical protein